LISLPNAGLIKLGSKLDMPGWPHARIAIAVVVFGLAALGFVPQREMADQLHRPHLKGRLNHSEICETVRLVWQKGC